MQSDYEITLIVVAGSDAFSWASLFLDFFFHVLFFFLMFVCFFPLYNLWLVGVCRFYKVMRVECTYL